MLILFHHLQASENLGMAMIYTLVTSAKEWLSEQYGQDTSIEDAIAAEEAAKDDVCLVSYVFIGFLTIP